MTDWYKEEVECAHMYLDDLKIQRKDGFSLVGRIKELEKDT